MKRIVVLFIFFVMFRGFVFAQAFAQSSDTASHKILNELQMIRSFHEETRNQRQRAIEDKMRRDSISNRITGEEMVSDLGIMSRIEDNTHPDIVKDGWNLYGLLAIVIALFSALYTYITYKSQRETESNTKKLSQNMQRSLLNDLIRHLYRNFIITYTMKTKMEEIDYHGYPSEEHFLKLRIPMENIHLDAFYGDDEKFRSIHNLYLNLRNYNEEVEIALKHMMNPLLNRGTKTEDFGTLEFKVFYLTSRIIQTIKEIWGTKDREHTTYNYNSMIESENELPEDIKNEIKDALLKASSKKNNALNNIEVPGCGNFEKITIKDISSAGYTKLLEEYGIDPNEVCKEMNAAITEERKKNDRGAWKVRIIQF